MLSPKAKSAFTVYSPSDSPTFQEKANSLPLSLARMLSFRILHGPDDGRSGGLRGFGRAEHAAEGGGIAIAIVNAAQAAHAEAMTG